MYLVFVKEDMLSSSLLEPRPVSFLLVSLVAVPLKMVPPPPYSLMDSLRFAFSQALRQVGTCQGIVLTAALRRLVMLWSVLELTGRTCCWDT